MYQIRPKGKPVWQDMVAAKAILLPHDALVDSLGRVTFMIGDNEYRVGVRQIRLGGPIGKDRKPKKLYIPDKLPSEVLYPIKPMPWSTPGGKGKGASRRKANRDVKTWQEQGGGVCKHAPIGLSKEEKDQVALLRDQPQEKQQEQVAVESLEPNTMHTRRVPLLKTKRKIAFKESLPPKEGRSPH
jgi:hypothetical protein